MNFGAMLRREAAAGSFGVAGRMPGVSVGRAAHGIVRRHLTPGGGGVRAPSRSPTASGAGDMNPYVLLTGPGVRDGA
jgi:hypothetical protein